MRTSDQDRPHGSTAGRGGATVADVAGADAAGADVDVAPVALRGTLPRSESVVADSEDLDPGFVPFSKIEGDLSTGWLIICDHAENTLPERYGTLGLPQSELCRHIGYDIGAKGVSERLAALLGAPAVLSSFSRLLIDPNRGEDDPTLVMRLSDGSVVPGNARADHDEIQYRLNRFYRPYDRAVIAAIETAIAAGHPPALISIHSFTDNWRGTPRPWHAGILWDEDQRLVRPIIEGLSCDPGLVVGDNEPYTGALRGDTMNRHGTDRGLAHALIEIRQDLIADEAGMAEWAGRLADLVSGLADLPGLHDILDRNT
jgi:predicted N-formylglutamate amidohydrolase